MTTGDADTAAGLTTKGLGKAMTTVAMTVAEGAPATTLVVAGETSHATPIVILTAGLTTRLQTEVPQSQGTVLAVVVAMRLASADETALTDAPIHGPKTRTQGLNHLSPKVDKRSAKSRAQYKINQANSKG